jgi:molecular chaperone GrpE (heat shock protein)
VSDTPRRAPKADLVSAFNALDLALESQRLEAETADVVRALLPLIDGVERLCRGLDRQPPDTVLGRREALALLADMSDQALGRIELERTGCVGERVDPRHHEVVETRSALPEECGIVLEVVETGFVLHGRALRLAKVVAGVDAQRAR